MRFWEAGFEKPAQPACLAPPPGNTPWGVGQQAPGLWGKKPREIRQGVSPGT